MGATTFGDLLDQARGHLDACAAVPDSALRGATVARAALVTGRVALTLSQYLGDIAPYGMAEAITSGSIDRQARAAVDAREALLQAAASLRADDSGVGDPGEGSADLMVAPLAAAGTALTAGRDLLRTHFATGASGEPLWRTDWSAVIASAPVAGALLDEVARWAEQLGLLTARLAVAGAADAGVPVAVSQRLAEGCGGLLAAGTALAAGRRGGAAEGSDAELLHAIPAGFPPERQLLGDAETAGELAEGATVSAGRLRVIARVAAGWAAWSPAMTADSWRWTATGAAVICNLGEIMLTTLAGQPDRSGHEAVTGSQLVRAAEAAAVACDRWREVAAAWNEMSTDTRGLRSPSITDTSDLVVRLGRLAFADPGWTPVRSRRAPVREIADLAPDGRRAAGVIGAIHHAVDALACVATADSRAVWGAIRGSRIHVPTRTLPESFEVRYRYWNATPAGTAALMDVYQAATAASERLAAELDAVAVTVKAPSRVLAAARAAARSARETGGRETANGRAAGSDKASSADLELAVSAMPGPVEQAVRSLGGADLVALMRARAIDAAARKLIAEARDGIRHVDQPGLGSTASPSALVARSEAQVASASFPQGVGVRYGTGLATPEPGPNQMLDILNAPSRPPARITPKPTPRRRPPPPVSRSATSPLAPRPPPRPSATTGTWEHLRPTHAKRITAANRTQKWYCFSTARSL